MEHAKTGCVIPPDDPESLARAMETLLDADLRRRMGREAREFCVSFCDARKEVEGYIRAIEKAA